ncbi:MAG: CHAT domain-containing protein, partial [Bacteroidota bacterium]
ETAMTHAWAIGMAGNLDRSESLLQSMGQQMSVVEDLSNSIKHQCTLFLNEIYFHNGKVEKAANGMEKLLATIPSVDFNGVKVYDNIDDMRQASHAISYLLNCLFALDSEDLGPTCDQLYEEMMVRYEYQSLFTNSDSFKEHSKTILGQLLRYYSTQLNSADSLSTQKKIWNILEISKSRKIQEHNTFMAGLDGQSKDIFQQQMALTDSLVMLKQLAEEAPDQKRKVYELEEKLAQIKSTIKSTFPEYFSLQYQSEMATKEAFTTMLNAGQAAFSFFEDDSSFFLLKITQNDFQFFEEAMTVEKAEEQFAMCLLKTLDPGDQSAMIIPDGRVWNVAFSITPFRTDTTRFLLERLPISYAFSATTMLNAKRPTHYSDLSVLAFAYGDGDGKSFENTSMAMFRDISFNELPGSLYEIKRISEVMDGEFLKGSLSGERQFKDKSRDHNILHLAIHGEVNEQDPENSSLVFFDGGDDEDGRLYAYELYNMQLDAELAVLSACNTGSGLLRTGEGVQSLGRAFAFAGVPSLLLTRSKVSDLSTPYIMKYFYEGLSVGQKKSEALRNAQLRFLKDDADNITSHPKYWSPFYILGDDHPIARQSEGQVWIQITAIALITLLLLVVGWRYFRARITS